MWSLKCVLIYVTNKYEFEKIINQLFFLSIQNENRSRRPKHHTRVNVFNSGCDVDVTVLNMDMEQSNTLVSEFLKRPSRLSLQKPIWLTWQHI